MKLSDLKPEDYKIEQPASAPSGKMKLSDLHPDDYQVEQSRDLAASSESGTSLGSKLNSLAHGVASGATVGLGDEGAGAQQVVMDLISKLTGGDSITDVNAKLKAAGVKGDVGPSDLTELYRQGRDEQRSADKAAEEANPGINLLGNLGGSLLPGAGIASKIGTVAKGAPALQKIWNATKVGAAAGGAGAIGNSSADLTQGDVGKFAKDALVGTALGGATGGALQTGVETIKGLSRGAKSLLDFLGADKAKKSFKYGTEGIDLGSEAGLEKAGDEAIKQGQNLGLSAKEISKNAGQEIGDAKKLIRESGKKFNIEDQIKKVEDAINELHASDDPAAEKDIKLLNTYLDNLKLGKKGSAEYTPVKFKTTEQPGQISFDELPQSKVKGSFSTAEDEAMASNRAEELAKKLTSKAEQEGSQVSYKVVEDPNKGFFHVVEDSTKQIESQLPGEVSSEVVPGATKSLETRAGGIDLQNTDIDKSQDIINTLNRMSGVSGAAPELQTTPAINAVKQAAGGIKQAITQVPELAGANQKASAAYQALDTLGLSADDFVKDAITGQQRLTDTAARKLTNLVRQGGTDTSTGITASDRLKESLRLLGGADPEKAAALKPAIEKAGSVLDLAQKAQNVKFNKSSMIEKGVIRAPNKIGLSINNFKTSNPEVWNSVSQAMQAAGGAAARLGKMLPEISQKDDAGRNAMLFSLQQQPWAREVLDSWFDKDDKNKK